MKKGKEALMAVLLPALTMLPLAAGRGGMAATAAACTLPPAGRRSPDDRRSAAWPWDVTCAI